VCEDSVQSPTGVCIESSISALSGESGLMVRQMDCCWRRMERVHRGWLIQGVTRKEQEAKAKAKHFLLSPKLIE